jgi:phosphomannomutase
MPERDALYAAMILLNGIAEKSKYLYETLDQIQEKFGPSFYRRIDIKFPNQSEKEILENILKIIFLQKYVAIILKMSQISTA